MKKIIALIIGALVTAVANHAMASGVWSFDYSISGPRDARPVVHGDTKEMYFQFPDAVKPKSFYAKSCFGASTRLRSVLRGPYYVIPHPGHSVSVKTSKGTVVVEDRESCERQKAAALAAKKKLASSRQERLSGKGKTNSRLSRYVDNNPRPSDAQGKKAEKKAKKAAPIIYTLEVRSGDSLRASLTKQMRDWGMELSWGLGRDRLSTRDFKFKATSPAEAIDQALKAFQLKGWYASDSRTLYIIKESEG